MTGHEDGALLGLAKSLADGMERKSRPFTRFVSTPDGNILFQQIGKGVRAIVTGVSYLTTMSHLLGYSLEGTDLSALVEDSKASPLFRSYSYPSRSWSESRPAGESVNPNSGRFITTYIKTTSPPGTDILNINVDGTYVFPGETIFTSGVVGKPDAVSSSFSTPSYRSFFQNTVGDAGSVVREQEVMEQGVVESIAYAGYSFGANAITAYVRRDSSLTQRAVFAGAVIEQSDNFTFSYYGSRVHTVVLVTEASGLSSTEVFSTNDDERLNALGAYQNSAVYLRGVSSTYELLANCASMHDNSALVLVAVTHYRTTQPYNSTLNSFDWDRPTIITCSLALRRVAEGEVETIDLGVNEVDGTFVYNIVASSGPSILVPSATSDFLCFVIFSVGPEGEEEPARIIAVGADHKVVYDGQLSGVLYSLISSPRPLAVNGVLYFQQTFRTTIVPIAYVVAEGTWYGGQPYADGHVFDLASFAYAPLTGAISILTKTGSVPVSLAAIKDGTQKPIAITDLYPPYNPAVVTVGVLKKPY